MGLITDATIIYSSIKTLFPELEQNFKNNDFDSSISNFLHKWLIGLFTQNLNDEVLTFVWDMFLLEGNAILIQVSLILFAILETQILNNKNKLKGIYSILNEQFKTVTSKNLIKSYFRNHIYSFDPVKLKMMQRKVTKQYLDTFQSPDEDTITLPIYFSSNFKKCNIKYPYCINIDNFEIKKEGIHFLIYSRNQEPEIIKDYLCKEGNKKIQSTFSSEIDEEEEEEKIDIYDILVERRHHICDSVEIDSSESKRINSNLFIASDTMNEKATMHRNIVRKRTIANVSKIPQLAYDQDQYLQKATQSFFDTNNKSFY